MFLLPVTKKRIVVDKVPLLLRYLKNHWNLHTNETDQKSENASQSKCRGHKRGHHSPESNRNRNSLRRRRLDYDSDEEDMSRIEDANDSDACSLDYDFERNTDRDHSTSIASDGHAKNNNDGKKNSIRNNEARKSGEDDSATIFTEK